MPIAAAPRHPQLLTVDQRIPSAEINIRSNIKKNPCSSSAQMSKQTRSIRFYEVVSIRSTIHLNDMTDDEIDDAWYTREEMTDIKRRMAAEVKHWVAGKPMNENLSTRGLEFRTREGSQKRKANKINAIMAVLDEQDLQKVRGIDYNPEGLRSVYEPHALRCLQAAQVLAMGDARECKLIRKMDLEIARARQQKARVAAEIKKEPSKRGNMFKRLFANKREVMQEIKALKDAEEAERQQ